MSTKNSLSFEKVRSALFFSLLIILFLAFVYIIRPFFFSLFWAAIIAILLYPMHKKINKYINAPSLSAIISLILVVVLIFLPLTLLLYLIIQQSVILYSSFSTENIVSNVQGISNWLRHTPISPYIIEISSQWTEYAASVAKTISLFLFENIKAITQNSVRFIFMLVVMFYTLFFFFKDGGKIVTRLSYVSPLGNEYEKMLYEKFRNTALSTIKTTIIIGGIQGMLGGLLFWSVGIKSALLWGIVMTAVCVIPALGSFIIWLPAALIMFATGNIIQGIIILIIGAFVISVIDNLLRPILVGKGTEMHPIIVLFSTLGGIFLFGISGFIIGPIVSALFLSILSIYLQYYKNELQQN